MVTRTNNQADSKRNCLPMTTKWIREEVKVIQGLSRSEIIARYNKTKEEKK
jgi:hypothetical protein